VLLGTHTEFAIESVMPDLLHIIPVNNDAVFNGLLNLQNAAFALCLLTNVDLALVETNHDAGDLWAADHSAENCTGCVVTCETRLTGSRSVVDHDSRYLFVHDY